MSKANRLWLKVAGWTDIVLSVHPLGLCRKARSLTAGFFLRWRKSPVPLYTKPPLTLEAQADLLIARGMAGERAMIIDRLGVVSYYRLTGYWYPFRDLPTENFRAGTHFNEVWDRYVFDRKLRLLVLDAIERFEVALRTQLAFHHSHAFGPFGYATDPSSLPGLKGDMRADFIESLHRDRSRSKETFVKHFAAKYGTAHEFLPIWMATEVATFGLCVTLYNNATDPVRSAVAARFGVSEKVLGSWLLTFNSVRNICAHHSRLWNRELGIAPTIPKSVRMFPNWHTPVKIPNDRVFGVLSICRFLLQQVAPQSDWPQRVQSLLAEHPNIPQADMQFIPNWERHAIWNLTPIQGN